jgi:hypothetical protein
MVKPNCSSYSAGVVLFIKRNLDKRSLDKRSLDKRSLDKRSLE